MTDDGFNQSTQNAMILAHLRGGNSVTFFDAMRDFGVMHLPRRILDIKEAGHNIESEWVSVNGKRFKRYWLVREHA
jgi:hypothetical protein